MSKECTITGCHENTETDHRNSLYCKAHKALKRKEIQKQWRKDHPKYNLHYLRKWKKDVDELELKSRHLLSPAGRVSEATQSHKTTGYPSKEVVQTMKEEYEENILEHRIIDAMEVTG